MTAASIQTVPGELGGGATLDWRRLLAEHDRWLRTVALARLGECQAVDDVMQEVALAAVKGGSRLLDATKAAPWLYRLTVTQVLLYRRKQGRRRKLVGRYADRVQPTETDHRTGDPLDWLVADERRQWVRDGLEQLSRRDREVLLLKYSEDWNYHEIAAHLGISHSAVEARLHRARGRLRELLLERQLAEAG